MVLDASAVLALLRDEPGAELVANALRESPKDESGYRGLLSAVNAVEVLQVATRAAAEGLLAKDSPIGVVAFTTEHARKAAEFREPTRHLGLSLADRACLALGDVTGHTVLTGDGEWLQVSLGVTVRHIRPQATG
ncbi:MAG: type II toxin-antitoxin system VapC family toxin [Solirubrobacteraceae bacterium]